MVFAEFETHAGTAMTNFLRDKIEDIEEAATIIREALKLFDGDLGSMVTSAAIQSVIPPSRIITRESGCDRENLKRHVSEPRVLALLCKAFVVIKHENETVCSLHQCNIHDACDRRTHCLAVNRNTLGCLIIPDKRAHSDYLSERPNCMAPTSTSAPAAAKAAK